MKKLSKEDIAKKSELLGELQQKSKDIEAAVMEVNTAIDDYNDKLQEAKDWAAEIVGQIEEFIEDKSEKWQEGENGSAYGEWKDEYDNFTAKDDLEAVEVEVDGATDFENLPEEPSL